MVLPALCICGGVGILMARVLVRNRKRSLVTGVESGISAGSHSGSSSRSARGSSTQPERIWAPTSLPFSTTQTDSSGLICFSRIAAARPPGPAPTTSTSNAIDSRGVSISDIHAS